MVRGEPVVDPEVEVREGLLAREEVGGVVMGCFDS